MIASVVRLLLISLLLFLAVAACGGADDNAAAPTGESNATGEAGVGGPPAESDAVSAATTDADVQAIRQGIPTVTPRLDRQGIPTVTPQQSIPTVTPQPAPPLEPNELGQVPILEYHHIGDVAEQFVRTPEQFRSDLQWLYDHDFHVINLRDFLAGNIDIPAGKRPVVLTFDDSPVSQFRLLPLGDGQYAIDPNSAIGMMEAFFNAHPDFGRGGHFAVLPDMLFDWTPAVAEPDQTPLAQLKMEWLRDNGYEIGNHTRDHTNMAKLSEEKIKYQLAEANIMIQRMLPDVPVDVVTLPYGMLPAGPGGGGDDTLLHGFDYKGQHFAYVAALLVGASPTVVPYSTEFDPYAVARIQAFDAELTKWFDVFESDPGILYVSDGDPNTVTVPNDLHPWLVGTLDETKLNGRQLVRY